MMSCHAMTREREGGKIFAKSLLGLVSCHFWWATQYLGIVCLVRCRRAKSSMSCQPKVNIKVTSGESRHAMSCLPMSCRTCHVFSCHVERVMSSHVISDASCLLMPCPIESRLLMPCRLRQLFSCHVECVMSSDATSKDLTLCLLVSRYLME